MSRALRLIILGAPGSGKGTISKRILQNNSDMVHLSTGDILRDNIRRNTDLGIKTKKIIDNGKFVPDEIITELVYQKIKNIGNSSSWLLDGFPRNLVQAKYLDEIKVSIDKVINLNVPFSIIIKRLENRWIHSDSGRVYNLEFNPPKTPFKDDITGEPLVQRLDDEKEVVLNRLKTYENQTKQLIDYYDSKKLLETFTGETSDYIWPFVRSSLDELKKNNSSNLLSKIDNYIATAEEPKTHTGQIYDVDDYRRVRFNNVTKKIVNQNFAIDLVSKDPIVVSDKNVVCSSAGGALGHPKIYINLDRDEVHDCGYSGRRFILKKFYDESKHGKSISYDDYMKQIRDE